MQDFPPQARDKARLVKLLLARAALGARIGTPGWDQVRDRVMAEAGNFDAMIGVAEGEAASPEGLKEAVWGVAVLHSLTGLASVSTLSDAATRLRKLGDAFGDADCTYCLGFIAYNRSDHPTARSRFEEALPLYRNVGDLRGEANCMQNLGDIALARSDHDAARGQYEAALALYRKVGNVLGEANCIQSLGGIALARSDHDGAREKFEAALALYRKVGNVLGEANCIQSLGGIAFARSDHAAAREKFEAALPLYRKVGGLQGEADCIQGLGDIDEANEDIASARRRWSEALALCTRMPDPYRIGGAHLRLARRAATPAEAAVHRKAALQAWASIGRADLMAEHFAMYPGLIARYLAKLLRLIAKLQGWPR